MKSRLTLFLFLAAFPLSQLSARQIPGLPFLNMGIGAHAQAMGNAYSAQARDASATYWNPSALSSLQTREVFLYHTQFINDFQHSYLSYAHPLQPKGLALGFALGYFSKGTYEGRDESGERTEDFTAADSLFSFSGSKQLTARVSLGGSFKAIRSAVASFSATGIAFDLSSTYSLSPKTTLVAGIYNLGPSMKYMDQSFQLPAKLVASVSHRIVPSISLTGEGRYRLSDQRLDLSAGAEFNLASFASLRAGYLSQSASAKANSGENGALNEFTGLGMGAGLKLFGKTSLDYAFIPMGEFGGTHHMNLTWKFR